MTSSSLPEPQLSDEDPPLPSDLLCDAEWKADIEQLYRHRADSLIRHFAGETRDGDSARDLVHEAFSRLAGLTLARRVTLSRPESYLFRICLNLFHDRGRAEIARRAHQEAAEEVPTLGDPVVQLECRDTLRRLEKAMLRLKPKTRAIFLARRLDGLSYAEIAERTGLSVWGVEKQMAKAIEAIDRMMDRD